MFLGGMNELGPTEPLEVGQQYLLPVIPLRGSYHRIPRIDMVYFSILPNYQLLFGLQAVFCSLADRCPSWRTTNFFSQACGQ